MTVITKKDIGMHLSTALKDIIKIMSFNDKNVLINGSFAYRNNIFATDIDLDEMVNEKNIKTLAKKFKTIVKNITTTNNIFITDIKLGYIPNWDIIPETDDYDDYNKAKYIRRANKLLDEKIITNDEHKQCEELLTDSVTPLEFEKIKKEFRFGLIRWKPKNVLDGEITLRDNTKYTLEDGLKSDSVFKLDTIALLNNNRYTEVTIIYELRINNKRLNNFKIDFIKNITDEIYLLIDDAKYFKAMKRLYALCLYSSQHFKQYSAENEEMMQYFNKLFNSNLGELYSIITQIGVIIEILEEKRDNKHIHEVLDDEINRLAHLNNIKTFVKNEKSIINKYKQIINKKKINVESLTEMKDILTDILNYETLKIIQIDLVK